MRNQRSMNSAYWHEVAPRTRSLWIAPPHNGWSVSRRALRLDDCAHSSAASSYQPSPRSLRRASNASKRAVQSNTGRDRTRQTYDGAWCPQQILSEAAQPPVNPRRRF
jgi:hypothetical protein